MVGKHESDSGDASICAGFFALVMVTPYNEVNIKIPDTDMTIKPLHLGCLLGSALLAGAAHAARPTVVDDASISGPKACQLESWTQHTRDHTEYWAVPACVVGDAWELSAGLGRVVPKADRSYHAGTLQAKTVFKQLETNGWGIGLTVATVFKESNVSQGDVAVIIPLSASLLDDKVLLHTNIGWLHGRDSGVNGAIGGVAGEWQLNERVAFVTEAYRPEPGRNMGQLGLRLTLIPEKLAFDIGAGSRLGHTGIDRYYTVGLTFTGSRP